MMMTKSDYTNTSSSNQTRGGDPPATLLEGVLPQQQHHFDDDDQVEDSDYHNDDDICQNTQDEHQSTVVEVDQKSLKVFKNEPFALSQGDEDSQITVHTIRHSQQLQQQAPQLLQPTTVSNGSVEENESPTSNVISSSTEAMSPTPVNATLAPTQLSQRWNQGDGSDSLRSIPTASLDVPLSPKNQDRPRQVPPASAAPVLSNIRPTDTFGAYRVTKIRSPNTNQYKVMVPESVQPGTDFLVEIPEPDTDASTSTPNNRRVQVTCPIDIVPGDPTQNIIDIIVPVPAVHWYHKLKVAQLTTAPTTSSTVAGRTFCPMLSQIRRINEQATNMGATIRTQVITIPDHAVPGNEFSYYINGHIRRENNRTNGTGRRMKLKIACPDHLKPGDRLRIVLPAELPEPEPIYQLFNAIVPDGVSPGGQFAVEIGLGNTQQVLVECPPNVKPGDVISIQLPTRTVVDRFQAMTYPSTGTGWKRTVRLSDLHFQWVRLEESIVRAPQSGHINGAMSINTDRAIQSKNNDTQNGMSVMDWTSYHEKAYVRKLVHLEGNDPRLRTASLTLVSAETASAQSKLKTSNGILLFSYADIAHQQGQPLQEKHAWFLEVCQRLAEYASTTTTDTTNTTVTVPTDHTMSQSVLLLVRREHLLTDSLKAILSLSIEDMRRPWEIVFIGENGIDQGGLTKEWLQCLTEQVFLPSTGLFVPSLNNQAAVDINPASAIACPHYHLLYFRFVGRVLGRALFTGQLIRGHFVRLLYKHLLGWPITIEDIRDQDDGYYSALHEVIKMDDASLASVGLYFTADEEFGEVRILHEYIENGADVEVCKENLTSYVDASIRYRLFDRILPQLTELLLGFYDVVPEQALAVFDANELELVLCGLPRINADDWQSNTVYNGSFETGKEQPVQWFWEIVREEYDIEMKARLLQFVTGTSGVPPGGFAFLKGGDDTPRKFTIQGVDVTTSIYPKAHTCFNVLDLPNYSTKDELRKRLSFSITTSYVGFEAE